MILLNENLFLIVLGFIWIIGAVLQDLRRKEVDNLWNFSLIVFALSYRLFVSVYINDYRFILNGVLGFLIFLFLGNLFYYMRLFAGGDAKLLIALGTILPLSFDWANNLIIFGYFILLFLFLGSIYALIWSLFLIYINFSNFKNEFKVQWKNYRKLFWLFFIFSVSLIIFSLLTSYIGVILIGFIVLLFPFLFVFAKSVEESCMIKEISPKKVTEGDWLYKDIVVGRKKIRSNWEGVSKQELKLIKEKYKKKIMIKQGIPFTPSFLFAFIGLIYISKRYGFF